MLTVEIVKSTIDEENVCEYRDCVSSNVADLERIGAVKL